MAERPPQVERLGWLRLVKVPLSRPAASSGSHLSAHTVRDRLTSIVHRVGVSTLGEPAAHLFCEGKESER